MRYLSTAELLAVVEEGEQEHSRPGTRWETERPAAYWREKPRAEVVAEELQELQTTRRYLEAMRQVLAGEATGEALFLAQLAERWVAEFEKQALVANPDGTFSWPAVRADDDRGVAGVERFAATPGKGRGGVAALVEAVQELGPEHLLPHSKDRLWRWCAGVRTAVEQADAAGVVLGETASLRSTDSGTPYIRKFACVMERLAALVGLPPPAATASGSSALL